MGINLYYREFGPKVLNLKTLMKQVPVILDHRDGTVREEGKKLCIELYRWIGPALKPFMQDLKPVQVSNVNSLMKMIFEEVYMFVSMTLWLSFSGV